MTNFVLGERKMEKRKIASSVLLWLILVFHPLTTIYANTEGELSLLFLFEIKIEQLLSSTD